MSSFFVTIEYCVEQFDNGFSWSAWNGDKCVDEAKTYWELQEEAMHDAKLKSGELK